MAEELRESLHTVLEADRRAVEANLDKYRDIILKVREAGQWSIPIWVEGVESTEAHDSERTFSLLECAGYISITKNYGHRNIYHQIALTERGKALAEKLAREK